MCILDVFKGNSPSFWLTSGVLGKSSQNAFFLVKTKMPKAYIRYYMILFRNITSPWELKSLENLHDPPGSNPRRQELFQTYRTNVECAGVFLEEGFRIFDDLSPVEGVFYASCTIFNKKGGHLGYTCVKTWGLDLAGANLMYRFCYGDMESFFLWIIEHGMFPWAPSTNMAINTSVAINPFSLNLGNKSFLYLLGA